MRSFLSSLAALAGTVGPATASPFGSDKPSFDWDETKYMIAFGDSYTFVQGTAGLQGFSFIGDYLPGNFSFGPTELETDKIVQNFYGTSAGGPNWIEFLSGCAVEDGEYLPAECPIELWDFAFAGADVAEAFTALHHPYTVPLVNQTQQYLAYAEPVIGEGMDKSKTLVAVWIGINDIGDTAHHSGSFPALYEDIMDAVFAESVQPLYGAGYRNFLFVNLHPLDRTPPNVGKANPVPSSTMLAEWNSALASHAAAFGQESPDATSMLYDAHSFLGNVLDNASQYGFKNTTGYCPGYTNATVVTDPGLFGCIPIDEYFWFNTGHITSHVHKILAADIDRFLKEQLKRH